MIKWFRRLPRMIMRVMYKLGVSRFRENRLEVFNRNFEWNAETQILDIGAGNGFIWRNLVKEADRPKIVAADYELTPQRNREVFTSFLQADGCQLPFPDKSFEIVWSNSTIEHVGDSSQQAALAEEIRRVGRGYYVQVPNRWFPLEPHTLLPFTSFLPYTWSNWIYKKLFSRPDFIRLLSYRQVSELFPDAEIFREKFLGLTKSFMAVRRLDHASESGNG